MCNISLSTKLYMKFKFKNNYTQAVKLLGSVLTTPKYVLTENAIL